MWLVMPQRESIRPSSWAKSGALAHRADQHRPRLLVGGLLPAHDRPPRPARSVLLASSARPSRARRTSRRRQPGHDRLGQLPRLRRQGRDPDPDLVRGERHVATAGRPGSPPSPRRRIAVARVSAAAEAEDQPALLARDRRRSPTASAASRSSATSTRRRTGGGIGPKRSVTSWRKAARSPRGPRPRQPPVQLELLRLVRDVVVGQVGLERQVDDGLRRVDDRRAALAASPSAPRPPRRASASRGRSRPPPCGPTARRRGCCPAPRISRSDSAIWKPAPSSEALKIAWSRLRASSAQPLAAPVEQVGVGAPAATARPGRAAGRAGRARACRRGR